MTLSPEDRLRFAQLAFARMDGAWFLALASRFGRQVAWEMDVEAWTQFSYVIGKHIRSVFIPDPVWPASFLEAMEIMGSLFDRATEVAVTDGRITIRVRDCEVQKAIAKAGVADCGIVTVQTYQGLARGLFGKEFDLTVEHTKNLNRGADCCEVILSLGPKAG